MVSPFRIVLQARFNSGRLPGKALLPVVGIPMVVLAAKRAARNGADLVVATSTEATDDPIVDVCRNAGLTVFRGSLDDVYSRFLGATADLSDDATVVRITADNVFPDADLIEALIEEADKNGAKYLAPRWPDDGLPYGVVAEVIGLGALRLARPESKDDSEHVTAAAMRAQGNPGFPVKRQQSQFRATVDTPTDYSCIQQVFGEVSNPITIDWQNLCDGLAELPRPRSPWIFRKNCFQSQLTLGAAQFGMSYGIANKTGMPTRQEISRIVHYAIDHGVTHIDTARLYGESEDRLGEALTGEWRQRVNLVTKIGDVDIDSPSAAEASVDSSISRSMAALRTDYLDIVLLHRARTRSDAGGAAWRHLNRLKQKGAIGRLGVSVQRRFEFDDAVEDPTVEVIQLPYNMLDRRWDGCDRAGRDILIHARSVYLQGLLTGIPASTWPAIEGAGALIETLNKLVGELGRQSLADLAVAYARSQNWIHSYVMGVETEEQLKENIALFCSPPLDQTAVTLVRQRIPHFPDRLLDPAQW